VKEYKNMSKKELLQEKAKIDFFLTDKNSSKNETHVELFYQVLTEYFYNNLGKKLAPLQVTKLKISSSVYKEIVSFCDEIDDWMNTVLKQSVKLHDRIRVYQIVVDLIVRYIYSKDRLVSLRGFLNNTGSFPGVIDRYFPGYVKAGMLKLIIRSDIQDLTKLDREDLL
jgi:hypothetical protein